MARPIERDGAFYHRARVPQDIVATFGKTRTGLSAIAASISLSRTVLASTNADDSLRLSVRRIDGEEVICQWVRGGNIREHTFHRSQLMPDIKRETDQELDLRILRGMLDTDAAGLPLGKLSIDELRKLEELSAKLRLASTGAIERKGGDSSPCISTPLAVSWNDVWPWLAA